MQKNTNYIIQLCYQLQDAGKKPSLALLRNLADRPLAIPEIMQVLKRWKADPSSLPDFVPEHATQQEKSLEQRVTELEEEVTRLRKLLETQIQNVK